MVKQLDHLEIEMEEVMACIICLSVQKFTQCTILYMYVLNCVHLFSLTQALVVDMDKQKLVRRVSIKKF